MTPFEKSLSLRINHACCILEIVSASPIYVHTREMEAIGGLQKALNSYAQLSTRYFNLFEKYYKATADRRFLIKGASQSVKQTAQLIHLSVGSDLRIDKSQRKQIHSLYSTIYTQNRLNAPYDFSRPSHQKDLAHYFHSNQRILECFKEMVSQIKTYTYEGSAQQLSLVHCHLLIAEMEMFEIEIRLLVDRLHVLNIERLESLDQVMKRCQSICNRSRFIFGASSPIYKLIKKHKLSVKLN